MMKAKIDIIQGGKVLLRDAAGNIRYFFADSSSGYVYENFGPMRHSQVCEKLAVSGPTLRMRDGESLADTIRREYRRMRREEKRGIAL